MNSVQEQKMVEAYLKSPKWEQKSLDYDIAEEVEDKTNVHYVWKMLSNRIFDWWNLRYEGKQGVKCDSDVSFLWNWWKNSSV